MKSSVFIGDKVDIKFRENLDTSCEWFASFDFGKDFIGYSSSEEEEYEIVLPKEKKMRVQAPEPPAPTPQNPFERPFLPIMFPY